MHLLTIADKRMVHSLWHAALCGRCSTAHSPSSSPAAGKPCPGHLPLPAGASSAPLQQYKPHRKQVPVSCMQHGPMCVAVGRVQLRQQPAVVWVTAVQGHPRAVQRPHRSNSHPRINRIASRAAAARPSAAPVSLNTGDAGSVAPSLPARCLTCICSRLCGINCTSVNRRFCIGCAIRVQQGAEGQVLVVLCCHPAVAEKVKQPSVSHAATLTSGHTASRALYVAGASQALEPQLSLTQVARLAISAMVGQWLGNA